MKKPNLFLPQYEFFQNWSLFEKCYHCVDQYFQYLRKNIISCGSRSRCPSTHIPCWKKKFSIGEVKIQCFDFFMCCCFLGKDVKFLSLFFYYINLCYFQCILVKNPLRNRISSSFVSVLPFFRENSHNFRWIHLVRLSLNICHLHK